MNKTIKSKQFKCSDLEKCTNRVLRVILPDILKPIILVECLTDRQIENIQRIGVSNWQKVQNVLHDHCYLIKRNSVVRQGIRKNAAKMSTQSNHRLHMTTTFFRSNVAIETSPQLIKSHYDDASSIDSDDIWNTSIQSDDASDDDDDDDSSLLNEDGILQYSEIDSNSASPYPISESDLHEIYNDDTNMNDQQYNDDSLNSYSDDFDDDDDDDDVTDINNGYGSLGTANNRSEMDDGYVDDREDEEYDEELNNIDIEKIISALANKNDVGPKNTDEMGQSLRSAEIIFNNVCLKNLHNKCIGYKLWCPFDHQLPEASIVFRNLQRAEMRDIEEAHQQLLMHYDKLLAKYWPTFCSFYGRQNYREYLRLAIGPLSLMDNLCNEYNLLSHIRDGFLKTGMNYNLCVKQILIELDESLGVEEQFYLVWPIVLDPRNTAINKHLEQFANVMINDLSSLNVAAIKEMLSIQIANESIDIRALTVTILKRCIAAIFQSIDATILTEYILYLRAFDEIGSKAIQQRADSFAQQMR